MKNYPVIALAALAGLFLASCESYDLPNPPAQSNPDLGVYDSQTLAFTSVMGSTVDLPALKAAERPVDMFNVTYEPLPAPYKLQPLAEFSATDAYSADKTVSLPMSVDSTGMAYLPVAEVQAAFNQLISKSPDAKDIYLRVAAYAVNGTSSVRLGGKDQYYFNGVVNVKPCPQENIIEDGYYLVGSFCDWNVENGIAFTQIEEGNPYDHPEFMVKIDVTAAQASEGYMWKVVPKSAFEAGTWAGAYGAVVGDSNLSGSLVAAPEAETEAGTITQEGPYIIKINLETLRYSIDQAFDYLWVPGFGSSTSNFDRIMRLTNTGDYIHYEGTMRLSNRFWFTGQPSLNGVNYRPDGDQEDNDGVLSGKMIYDVTSTATMKVPTAGLYYIQANIINMTWKATPIPVLNLVGGFNGWTVDTAPAMTPNSQKTVWTITQEFAEAGEFKACVNNSWALSYGTQDGTFNSVWQNAGNYKIEEPGTYEISFHFDVFPNYVSVVKK